MPKLLDLQTGALLDIAAAPELEIGPERDLMAETPDLAGVRTLQLAMPGFKDGRAMTQARLLRERFGFEGEIRMTGYVLPDQVVFLKRLGVSTVEIEELGRLDDFRFALTSRTRPYQRPAGSEVVFELREGAL
jgi:uncharacterized protein (DUF934 family)